MSSPPCDEGMPHIGVKLYEFQKEVYYKALHGDNIVFLPTGAGKTIVAAAIAAEKALRFPEKKIVFIVHRVPLVQQQAQILAQVIPNASVEMVSGQKKTVKSWLDFMHCKSVALVIIDSVFYEWIFTYHSAIATQVSLTIFDEVHNALGGFYRKIIEYIHEFKPRDCNEQLPDSDSASNDSLPQILGLTASPVLSFTQPKSLVELVATTRCRLVSVTTERADLLNSVPVPLTTALEYHLSMPEKLFQLHLRRIASKLHTDERVTKHTLLRKLITCHLATPGYINKCGQLRIAALQGSRKQYDFFAYGIATFLLNLSRALVLLEGDSLRKAYETLMGECVLECMRKSREVAALLLPILDGVLKMLETLRSRFWPTYKLTNSGELNRRDSFQMSSRLRFLLQLLEWICNAAVKNGITPSGIVFCDTRASVHHIVRELQASPKLNAMYRPEPFIGKGKILVEDEDVHMTEYTQGQVLRRFKCGVTKLLVATAVAEEGLDIEKCNFVVRYDSCVSLRGFIQSRGRARCKKAIYIVMEHALRRMKVADVVLKALVIQEHLVARFCAGAESEISFPREPWDDCPLWWLRRFEKRTGAVIVAKELVSSETGEARSCCCELSITLPPSVVKKDEKDTFLTVAAFGALPAARLAAQKQLCSALFNSGYLNCTTGELNSRAIKPLRFLSTGLCICQTSSLSVEDVRRQFAPDAVEVVSYNPHQWNPCHPSSLLFDVVRELRLRQPKITFREDKPNGISITVWRRSPKGAQENSTFFSEEPHAVEVAAMDALRFLGVAFLDGVPHDIRNCPTSEDKYEVTE